MNNKIMYLPRRVYRAVRRRWKWWSFCVFPFGKKLFIPGTPLHTNLGDSAIVLAEMSFLKKCGVQQERMKEIDFEEYPTNADLIQKYIGSRHVIAQLGGGNMGSQWIAEEYFHRRLLKDLPKNRQVIFPQTIYYIPDENGIREETASVPYYNGKDNLTMVARESKSYETMRRLYPDTEVLLVPDIVLSATMETFGVQPNKRHGAMLCMRADAEQSMSNEAREKIAKELENRGFVCRWTDMYSETEVTKETRYEMVRSKMQEFADAELVVTDRLHGMIFAAVTGTPCIAFSNYNYKVRGTYEWIRYLPYIKYVETAEEAIAYIPELLDMKDCCYDNTPLQPYFEKLAEVVRR